MHTIRTRVLPAVVLLAVAGCTFPAVDPSAGAAPAADAPLASRAAPADAPSLSPVSRPDTIEMAPGAVLDLWLSEGGEVDFRALNTRSSVANTVVRGDFFRYATIGSDPGLRGFWNQPIVLRWTAWFEATEAGPHVFVAELSKERTFGAMRVSTLVRVNEETILEKRVRVFGSNSITEAGSRMVNLARGHHRMEIWLAVENTLALPPSINLGTFVKVRAPDMMGLEPLPLSRVWHRTR